MFAKASYKINLPCEHKSGTIKDVGFDVNVMYRYPE